MLLKCGSLLFNPAPVVDGCTTPLSRLVVPMVVVFVLILFIITLVVGVVDEVLLKLLLFDKTLLLCWCAADDVWPLASVGFEDKLSIGGGGKCCPLLSTTTDGGGFGDNIGDSWTNIFKWCWSVWNGSGMSSIKSKLCTLLWDRCKCKRWWWCSRWCGEAFVDEHIFGLPWSRQVPILIVSKFLKRKAPIYDQNDIYETMMGWFVIQVTS